jgi:hypothetical protein
MTCRGKRKRADFILYYKPNMPIALIEAKDTYVEFVRDGIAGNGAARTGSARWRRLTEERTGRREVGVPLRRAGIGGEIHPCRHSLAALHPPASRRAGSLLALRRVGHSGRALGHRRGLSGFVVARFRQ